MENPECDPRRGVRLVGDTWGTGGSPPSLGSPQCDTRLVTAWSPPSKALGLRTPSCRFFSCQDPRRPWLGRGCFLLLCSTRPPETDPSPPSHRQWWHPVASTAGQSVKGPSGKAGALTGSRTSRFYKRPEAARPASTNAMLARLRPAAGVPKLGAGRRGLGVFAGETC